MNNFFSEHLFIYKSIRCKIRKKWICVNIKNVVIWMIIMDGNRLSWGVHEMMIGRRIAYRVKRCKSLILKIASYFGIVTRMYSRDLLPETVFTQSKFVDRHIRIWIALIFHTILWNSDSKYYTQNSLLYNFIDKITFITNIAQLVASY